MNYSFNWEKILSGSNLDLIVSGIAMSLNLIIVSGILAVIIGILFSFVRMSKYKPLRMFASAYVELCRNIPTLIWLYFFYFAFPHLFPEAIKTAMFSSSSLNYWAGIIALSFTSSGYICEIFRGGVMSVHKEQAAAAYSSGLSKMQTWLHVIAPQALRTCFPALMNRLIHNTLNTSLCMAIGVAEIMWAARHIEALTFRVVEVMLVATAFYLVVIFAMQIAARLIEKYLLPIHS